MNVDQILTKSDQILTIYVKKNKMHVEKIQECHFLKIKKNPTSKIIQDLNAEEMLTLLDVGPENQNLVISIPTISIYQNSPISIFQFFGGGVGGIN